MQAILGATANMHDHTVLHASRLLASCSVRCYMLDYAMCGPPTVTAHPARIAQPISPTQHQHRPVHSMYNAARMHAVSLSRSLGQSTLMSLCLQPVSCSAFFERAHTCPCLRACDLVLAGESAHPCRHTHPYHTTQPHAVRTDL